MKKPSRRAFNKQLTNVLAALPLMSVVAKAQRRGRRSRRQPEVARSTLRTDFRSEHNTPPPALFMGGSLVFETFSAKDDWDVDGDPGQVNGANRNIWSVTPRPYSNGMSPSNI